MAQSALTNSEKIQRLKSTLKRAREGGEVVVGRAVVLGTSVATAAAIGYMRGQKADEKTGDWTIGKSKIDWELVLGIGIGGLGVTGVLGKHSDIALASGSTALAIHVARKVEKSTVEAKKKKAAEEKA